MGGPPGPPPPPMALTVKVRAVLSSSCVGCCCFEFAHELATVFDSLRCTFYLSQTANNIKKLAKKKKKAKPNTLRQVKLDVVHCQHDLFRWMDCTLFCGQNAQVAHTACCCWPLLKLDFLGKTEKR